MPIVAISQSKFSMWGEVTQYEALVVTNDEQYPDVSWFLVTSIDHSVSGEKRIYISLQKYISGKPVSICEDKDPIYAKVNGQAIRFSPFCRDYESNGEKYKETYITPLPSNGDKYLYNSFKKSSEHIIFELWGIRTPISSVGFSKAWKDFGGNAL